MIGLGSGDIHAHVLPRRIESTGGQLISLYDPVNVIRPTEATLNLRADVRRLISTLGAVLTPLSCSAFTYNLRNPQAFLLYPR